MAHISRLQQMDECAWEELLVLYKARLHRDIIISLRKRGLAAAMAEDIEQQTWMTAVQKIHSFVDRGEDKLYCWLRAISVNHVRSLQRQQDTTAIPDSECEGYYGYYAEATEQIVIRREQLAAIFQVIGGLKPQVQHLLLRCLLGEKPETLVASFPHLKRRSISQAMFRARRRIRAACMGAEVN